MLNELLTLDLSGANMRRDDLCGLNMVLIALLSKVH